MSSNRSISFQNSFVRYEVGAPVVPVLKAIHLRKKGHCDICNNEYQGSFDDHVVTPQHQVFATENHELYPNSDFNSLPDTEIDITAKLSSYDPEYFYGEEMLLPVKGFLCTVCDEFFNCDESEYETHCKSKVHYDNYVIIYHQWKQVISDEENKSFVEHVDSDELTNNPLPIRIKIENTDRSFNSLACKKPLSERLGALKKHNKLKKLKSQMRQCDDINESMRQFLPKPSSHITPSRKVFVDDVNNNVRLNGQCSKNSTM